MKGSEGWKEGGKEEEEREEGRNNKKKRDNLERDNAV